MPSLTKKIYNLVDAHTDESETKVVNANITDAANAFMTTLVSARDAGDLLGSYTYYSDISSSPDDATLGIDGIKESDLRDKIRASNAVFNFKNIVNSKYIIVYNQKCFLYSIESEFDDAITSFNWKLGTEVYSDVDIPTQYESSLSSIMNNEGSHA